MLYLSRSVLFVHPVYFIKRLMMFFAMLLLAGGISVTHASPNPQKVDKALDSNFEVALRNGYSYCVAPYQGKDNIYYAYETARTDSTDCIGYDWRYDVHGHISTIIRTDEGGRTNERYLCMTDVASDDTSTYSYVQLKPCSVNNVRQIWKYNDTSQQLVNQHTGNRLQEINWYLATSAKSSHLYDLKVTGRPILFALVPAPFTSAYQFNFHYPFDGKSYTQLLGKDGRISQGPLRYDPQTRQISTLMPDGQQYCLRSNMLGSAKDSEFVSFQACPDSYGDGIVPNPLKWRISTSLTSGENGRTFKLVIRDYNQNLLGVERSGGINIGTAYTIKPKAARDIPDRFKPWYLFQDGGEVYGRKTYMAGNYLGTLRDGICPASGVYQDSGNQHRQLPPNFNLQTWLNRLYRISTHPGGDVTQAAGVCGPCLLHAAEMLIEIQRHGNTPPGDNIDAQMFSFQAATSMASFRQRFPLLALSMDNDFDRANLIPFHPSAALHAVLASEYLNGVFLSTLLGREGLVMTTSNYFNLSGVLGDDDFSRMHDEMFDAPQGTLFVVVNGNVNAQGIRDGHATAFIRTPGGELHAIPTSEPRDSTSQARFNQMVNEDLNHPDLLQRALQLFRPADYPIITEAVIFTFRPDIQQTPAETFDENMFSVGNCTVGGAVGGAGVDHSAGGGQFLALPATLYQCSDGRCDTSARQAAANGDDNFVPSWPQQCEWLERVNHRWSWNGGSVWAKQHTSAASCRQANRCASGGGCYRWSGALDIGQCEHLWRNSQGQWQWFPYRYYTREKACRDANQCNGNGPCFRWNEGRP
ncbi:hypothetical protein NFHSH190041_34300 [Shewanella sp. NFH-SH190041]|nr:hypothetical protein NFHSH190041_34300 [Shewanella sp. NFH-SH190041]